MYKCVYTIAVIVALYTNPNKDADLSVTKNLIACFQEQGIRCAISAQSPDVFSEYMTKNERPDLVLVVGGDGTILRIAKIAAARQVPVLGINLGKVGFLTETEPQAFSTLAARLAQKKFTVESRHMLCATVGESDFFALNEFVVTRHSVAKMMTLSLYVDGEKVDSYHCDGMIVCTPTGSTAYSLSAGGPILSPRAGVFAVTPINSHSLRSRPIVVGDDEVVRLKTHSDDALVLCDGRKVCSLENKQYIEVKKSPHKALFVRLGAQDFYERLLRKLNTWSTTLHEED